MRPCASAPSECAVHVVGKTNAARSTIGRARCMSASAPPSDESDGSPGAMGIIVARTTPSASNNASALSARRSLRTARSASAPTKSCTTSTPSTPKTTTSGSMGMSAGFAIARPMHSASVDTPSTTGIKSIALATSSAVNT